MSTERVLVHKSIYKEFEQLVTERVKNSDRESQEKRN